MGGSPVLSNICRFLLRHRLAPGEDGRGVEADLPGIAEPRQSAGPQKVLRVDLGPRIGSVDESQGPGESGHDLPG